MEGVVGTCRCGGVYVCRYKLELPGSVAGKGWERLCILETSLIPKDA